MIIRWIAFVTQKPIIKRIDAIGEACIQLPEDHGLIFPGGCYLV
ncbi:DNA repair ATPase [Nitrincola tibetensis]|nr:DNA repair ATPase [Nitrincola tibetensis]